MNNPKNLFYNFERLSINELNQVRVKKNYNDGNDNEFVVNGQHEINSQ